MSYNKTQWVDNTTPIDKDNLNKIEQGIYDNSIVVDAITNKLNPTDTETYKTAELTEGQITDVIGVSDIIIKGQTSQDGTPTPSAPIDVNVVSGGNVINVENENLFYMSSSTKYTTNGIEVSYKKGYMYLNGTATSQTDIYLDRDNTTNYNKIKTYINSNYGTYQLILESSINFNFYARLQVDGQTQYKTNSFMINATSQLVSNFIRIPNGTVLNNVKLGVMISTNITTFTPHQGKKLPLDLGTIELCKIGDYQDYFYKSGSKWYLHKEIGKFYYEKSSDWLSDNNGRYFKAIDNIVLAPNNTTVGTGKCNVGLVTANQTLPGDVAFKDGLAIHSTVSRIYISSGVYDNITTTPTLLYYAYITPTNTEITDTNLISQLEAIYNAPLYEQTNITQENNDLPMVLDITACKDNINGIKAFIRK